MLRTSLSKTFPYLLITLAFLTASYPFCNFKVDDAYISFTYARNLTEGNGLTYNGMLVEGYSNFLWTLLISPFTRWMDDPIWAARLFSVISGLLSLYIIFGLSKMIEGGWYDGSVGRIVNPIHLPSGSSLPA